MNSLPIVGSSARMTSFVLHRLEGPDGLHLFLDGNQKITAANGTYAEPAANAFSLVQGEDCPYRTPTCESKCYVHNLQEAQPDIHAAYRHNSREIRRILSGETGVPGMWAMLVAHHLQKHCRGGFRWHVSGDVFDEDYALWIAKVARYSPEVPHWIYTRSFHLVRQLNMETNLTVNLSCDRDNYWLARRTWQNNPGTRLCYLTVAEGDLPADLPEGSVIFPDYALRPRQFKTLSESPWWAGLTQEQRRMVCPVDSHGKSENVRCGPCKKCVIK